LLSICDLAKEKGYYFVGSNLNGNNAYFIKNKYQNIIPEVTIESGYREAKFREVSDNLGNPLTSSKKLNSLKGFKYFNTRTKQIVEL